MAYHSEQFEHFLMERMTGPEFRVFEAKVALWMVQPPVVGAFDVEFQAPGSRRCIRISYYWSSVLGQIFIVGGWILRRGEPTDLDQASMQAYLEAIRSWEAVPAHRPEMFNR